MGAYLSEPVTEKHSEDFVGSTQISGASSMQGWRVSQEDAHNCILDFDEDSSLFAVYDGHGGHEVAVYTAQHLPEFLKNTDSYKAGNLLQALEDAFLGFDHLLTTSSVIDELKAIAGTKEEETEVSDSEKNEELSELCEEANMPLSDLIAKYQEIGNPVLSKLKKTDKPISPFLRAKKGSCLGEGPIEEKKKLSLEDEEEEEEDAGPSSLTNQNSAEGKQEEVSNAKPGDSEGDGTEALVNQTTDETSSAKAEVAADSVKVNGADKKEVVVNGEGESTEEVNGEVENQEQTNENVLTLKGKGKGKGKSKMSNLITSNEPVVEDTELVSTKSKQTPEEMYRSIFEKDEDSESDESDENFEEHKEIDGNDDEEVGEEEEEDEDLEDEEEEDEENEEAEEEEEESELTEEDEFAMSVKEEPGSDSGCTAVVALKCGNELFVANAGDSRCIVCREGKAIEMSEDHKPEDPAEMSRIINAGGKVTSDGRVNGGLNLSRAIGDHAYKQNKNLDLKQQMITALPDVRTFTLDPKLDEFLVLACDGIWNYMSSDEVVRFVRERINKQEKMSAICEELFDYCLAPNTHGDGTGCDNMTAIIVKLKWPQEEMPKSVKRAADEITENLEKRPRLEDVSETS